MPSSAGSETSQAACPTPRPYGRPSAEELSPGSPVTLSWDNGEGVVFRRNIAVDADALFTIEDSVENQTGETLNLFPYGLISRHGEPKTLGYYVLHEGMIGVLGEAGLQEYSYSNVEDENVIGGNVRGITWTDNLGGWVGITDKYWAAVIIPDQTDPFQGRYPSSRIRRVRSSRATCSARRVSWNPARPAPRRSVSSPARKRSMSSTRYHDQLGILKFDLLIDWGWFYFITKPMFYALDFFYNLVGNFGVAILIVTVFLKILFLPLANKSYASMAKMKAVQPEMLALRDRYKDDRAKQQQELMELYKREKINPVAGCWPVLIQIPVFFALYKVLFVSIEMRHAPFFGWIQDLSAPDPTSIFNLFGLLPYDGARTADGRGSGRS